MFAILILIASFVNAQVGEFSALAVLQPRLGEVINAGDPFEIQWKPSAAIPTVDLVLKTGSQGNLVTSTVIARNLPNTGTYVWEVPRTMKTSTTLSLMIHDSRDPSISNFSPYFTILEIGRGITTVQVEPSTTTIGHGNNNRPTKTIAVHIKEHRSKSPSEVTSLGSTDTASQSFLEVTSPLSSSSSKAEADVASVTPRNKSKSSLGKLKAVSGCATTTVPSIGVLLALLIL